MKCRIFFLLISIILFYGCSKTTVILLPDDDGNVGKIVVKANKGESKIVDKAGYKTEVSSETSAPTTPVKLSEKELEKELEPIKDIEPPKPISFLLYFKNNSTELTPDSKAELENILKEIKRREPCEISLIGHSDTAGSEDYNIKLSKKRAEIVKNLLINAGIKMQKLTVTSHGENDLLVKTKDNVPEPKNRRVEVMVR
jgi:outer membrane protein OmpA-like peptidoglycan-associated protein